MKHTPGPWRNHVMEKSNSALIGVDSSMGFITIAEIGLSKMDDYRQTDKANAKLITAAPDMLEALRLANQTLNDHFMITDNDDAGSHVHDQIREAIKKATT